MDARRNLRVVAALAVLAAVVAGTWAVRSVSAERRAAEDRWRSREPSSYAYTVFSCGGMCAYCPVRVTIRDGAVVDAVAGEPGCSDPDPDRVLTVDDLFDLAADHDPWPFLGSTTITYDEQWGFPASITTTCDEGTSDCGSSVSVDDFTLSG